MQKSIICQYYLLSILSKVVGHHIISAHYATYLMKHGLTLFEVNMVNAIYFLVLFIFEIPTGAFADVFGRKASFIMSCALGSLGMLVYGLSSTIQGFIIAEIIEAIAMTFQSGAFNSWLVDRLKHYGHHGSCTKIFSRCSMLVQICGGIAAIAGSYMGQYNLSLPWFVGGTGMGITAMIAFVIMKEEYFVRTSFSWRDGLISMRDTAQTSIRYGIASSSVRFILIITFLQSFCFMSFNMYWQPFFRNHDVSDKHLGFIFFGMMVCLVLGSILVSKMHTEGKERSILIKTLFGTGGLVLLSLIFSDYLWLGILFFILHEVPRGFFPPISDGYLHSKIPSQVRASITSFCSLAPCIGGSLGLLISGAIAQYFGVQASWIVSSTILIIGSLLIARNGKGKAD